MEKELKVRKIEQGTVIDHIKAGYAFSVLRILRLTDYEGTLSVLSNVPSRKLGQKDIIKIEGRELNPEEVDKIALIAPKATINIIRNFEVVKKEKVKLPSVIRGMVKCVNPTCISNQNEPIEPMFIVEKEEPLRLRCYYCRRILEREDVLGQF
jgi:aspartate carbamoyltransferase regulatory subunit